MIKNLIILPFLIFNNLQGNELFLYKDNFNFENKDIIVRGNISNLNSDTFATHDLKKDLLVFNKESKIDGQYFAYFYDFESKQVHYLETNSSDYKNLYSDLKTFYEEFNTTNNSENNIVVASENSSTSNFKTILTNSFTKIAKPYGRITYNYTLSEYEFSKESSLYFLQVRQQFVCGVTCIANDEIGYEEYYNGDGYTHVSSYQKVYDMGYNDVVFSGIPVFKDAYPVPKPISVTITSTYSAGVTIGKSTEVGFSTKEGFNASHEHSSELDLDFTYSKTYTQDVPYLSSQNGEDLNEYQWNFKYNSKDTNNRDVTNFMNLGYIFECNKYENNVNVHNKFGMKISGKTMYVNKDGNDAHYVSASKNIM